MSGAEVADRQEIERALAVLFEPGQVVELRALEVVERGWPRTVSGYFDSMFLLAEAAVALSGRAKGVYVTANEINPALLARRANRASALSNNEPTTSDSAVLKRRWLLIDVDPARPAGISSSDAEHEDALHRAQEIREALRASGWPCPLFGDSGNGAHLLFRVDVPASDAGLIKGCLEALNDRFGDEKLSIDRTVYNPARIWKLYGTLCCKGDDLPERPHRLARLIDVPEQVEIVPQKLLESLAASAATLAKPSNQQAAKTATKQHFDLGAWIAEHALDVTGPEPWNGGQMWVFKSCPWIPDHKDTAAFVAQLASGALSAGCHHDGCSGNDWFALKRLFEGTDDADGADGRKQTSRGPSQASRMLQLVDESGADFWHTPGGDAYGTVAVRGHLETFALKGRTADLWLRRLYYLDSDGNAPGGQAVSDALNVLRGRALFDGDTRPVFVRVGEHEGVVYLDVGDADWHLIQISAGGWEVIPRGPIRFRRPKGLMALPLPARGGTVSSIRPFINAGSDDEFLLMLSTVVTALSPFGPYPVLILGGEQGSAKSTTSRVLRRLIDPTSAPLRAQPRDNRDLMIAANNNWFVTMDNLSDVPPWLSDSLCRLATGGGFSTRELYSDDEEMIFDAQRPVILTGIEDLARRSDLLDRSILATLPRIRNETRLPERELWQRFEAVHPLLLGSVLDAAVHGEREIGRIKIGRLPRLADFAKRDAAAAPALGWTATRFLVSYDENRAAAHVSAVEGSEVARTVVGFMAEQERWSGTAEALLDKLTVVAGDRTARSKNWPKSGRGLSGALRRVLPNLRELGIEVLFDRANDRNRTRVVVITRREPTPDNEGFEPSDPSAPSGSDSDADANTDDCGRSDVDGWRPPSDEIEPGADDLDGADDEERAFSNDHSERGPDASDGGRADRCRCSGCNSCAGAAAALHREARLSGEWRARGVCSWCARASWERTE